MEQPRGLRGFGFAFIVVGGLGFLQYGVVGVLVTALGFLFAFDDMKAELSTHIGSLLQLTSVAALNLLGIVAGNGVLKRRRRAYWLTLILSGFWLLFAVYMFLTSMSNSRLELAGPIVLLLSIVIMLWSAAVLGYFLRESVKRYFLGNP